MNKFIIFSQPRPEIPRDPGSFLSRVHGWVSTRNANDVQALSIYGNFGSQQMRWCHDLRVDRSAYFEIEDFPWAASGFHERDLHLHDICVNGF